MSTNSKTNNAENEISELPVSDNPQVFVSHDTRDAEIAEAFSKLLSSVSAGVLKSFRSSDNKGNQGIEYGVEWYPKILDALQKASDVVCLLTENSINRPWILFEAGMAKGKLNTPILGIAIGIPLSKVSTGPFAQFQNSDDDDNSLTKLVKQLVKKIPNSEPDEDVIRFQVQQFKKKIEDIIKKRKADGDKKENNVADADASAKLFEEVKIMFKELPSRIEMISQRGSNKEQRRIHPGMMEELMRYSSTFDSRIGLQMILSFIKNDLPWIYDGALDAYDKIQKTKSEVAAKKVIADFMRIAELTFEHPIMRDIYIENNYNYRVTRDIPRIIYETLSRVKDRKKYI